MTFLFDSPVFKGRKQWFNPRPIVPETNWKRPTGFPDLSGAAAIAVDLETKDVNLLDKGAGWARNDGHPVGVAIATDDGFCGYYPTNHEEESHDNFPPEQVFDWLRVQLSRSYQTIVGHNLLYDLGYLAQEGIEPVGELFDTWIAEKLIRHRAEASLEATGQRRVGKGKKAALLLRWLTQYFGRGPTPSADEDLDDAMKGFIYKAPPRLVGPYGESDVLLPLEIGPVQQEIMEKDGLMDVFQMECALLPLFVKIRMSGVRVDLTAAEAANEHLQKELHTLQGEVNHIAGRHIEITSRNTLGEYLTELGIKVPLTEKTKKFSVTDKFLQKIEHPFAEKAAEFLELSKFKSSFIEGAVLESHVKGRVHGELNPLQAVTGRMSASNPNTQQIPSKNPELSKVIRSIFIPDENHAYWRKDDYSSVECRLLAHFAVGPGSDTLREEYIGNPNTDYHNFVQRMVKELTGLELPRKHIKTVVFSGLYGASDKKMGRIMGLSKEEVEPFFAAYHGAMQYVRNTMDHYSRVASTQGFTQTIMGRRAYFDLWEPRFWTEDKEDRKGLPLEKAVVKYGSNIRRSHTHKGINFVIQGSAADLMKMALLKCWKAGIYDVVGVPKLIVHDESSGSVPEDSPTVDAAFREMQNIMQTAISFSVPILVAAEKGRSWGETSPIEQLCT